MKSNYSTYDFEKSRTRIKDILDASDTSFEEVVSIPSRDKLTFNNGFYVTKTSALFVDIRSSSELPKKYRRPTLAKIYRGYISELIAIINGDPYCAEVNINGDCVWGVFDSQYQNQINSILSTSAQISSFIDYLNCRFNKKGIDPISVGIGIAFGRILMIKAGYSGSGINEVVWMGDVVNEASNLCAYGNKRYYDNETMISEIFYNNLNDHNKSLFTWNLNRSCYHGNIINTDMNDWLENNNCK
ncbi:adenylate/guanylate cyclase domain-containing protein [Ekhidna sp.]|jgi:class 3 adenylate cyclase|uniref:adenylate/guanylate cyclase domain-containing protein n=1 Tax=Ekhidna sp. TaxID=2608089 RepID=UPI0032EFE2DE